MLGAIPGAMADEWYHDKNGNTSRYYFGDDKSRMKSDWRDRFHYEFNRHIVSKGDDWKDLHEQRVVLEDNGFFLTLDSVHDRQISYDFEELEGRIGLRRRRVYCEMHEKVLAWIDKRVRI